MNERKQGNPGPLVRALLDIAATMSPAERRLFWLRIQALGRESAKLQKRR